MSTFSNIFSSETTGPTEAKFHVEPPWDGGRKVYSNSPGHMASMATMPISGKKHKKIFFSGTKRLMILKLGMQHQVLEYYRVCSNDDDGLTLTFFTVSSNLFPYAFVWEHILTVDFLETIEVYDLKVGT